eukprot:jgi/Botrbrau1/8047/Bobra.13_2s0016.1
MNSRFAALALFVVIAAGSATAKVYFEEKFNDGWQSRWKESSWKEEEGARGKWEHSAGDWFGHEHEDKGIRTSEDYRFYTLWSEFPEFTNKGKDLVLQFSVKHAQKLDCGGGYIKLLPAASADQMKHFGGETPYSIMFGPDICGYTTKKVHVIVADKEGKNHEMKKEVFAKEDELTHVYTLIISANNTFKVLIDNEIAKEGDFYEDFEILPPRKIRDPDAKKPEDWDEREKIDDPEDVKPEGWDDEPEMIVDAEATKPEDWDDEEDGEWEAPQIKNPKYKGAWKVKKITNPAYKGKWEAPLIDNPEFKDDTTLYHFESLKFIGFEIWQVKAGTIFDNVLVTDDAKYAHKFAEDTFLAKGKKVEKDMFDEIQKKKEAEEEEKRKKLEAEKEAEEDEDEEEEEEKETATLSSSAANEGRDEL